MINRYLSEEEKTNQFIEKSNIVHNSFYNYEKTIYKKTKEKVTITCPIHGDFNQTPNMHLSGQGCPECGIKKSQKHNDRLRNKTKQNFLKRMEEKFGNKYDFTKFEYVKDEVEGIVICPIHGEFKKKPNHLRRGQGCPTCSKESKISKGEKQIMNFLNENNIDFTYNYTIKKSKYLKNKPFDFYVPNLNLLIEFQGEQHYKKKFNMSDEDLKERKIIDYKKKKYAEHYGYKTLIINYNENVEEKLKETI